MDDHSSSQPHFMHMYFSMELLPIPAGACKEDFMEKGCYCGIMEILGLTTTADVVKKKRERVKNFRVLLHFY